MTIFNITLDMVKESNAETSDRFAGDTHFVWSIYFPDNIFMKTHKKKKLARGPTLDVRIWRL